MALKRRLRPLKLGFVPVDLASMSATDHHGSTADAAHLEAEMDAELSALEAKTPGDARHPRNQVFLREQEEGGAMDADEATETAARVTGELAAEADQERLMIERQVAALEGVAPGSAAATDAEDALTRAERAADGAVSSSLDSGEAAEDARRSRGSRFLHRGSDSAGAGRDESRALADETAVAEDLAELDALEQRVAGDRDAAPPPVA
jgi:hypothetical protein